MIYKTEQNQKLIAYLRSAACQLPMQTIVADMKAQGVAESTTYRLMRELVEAGEVRRFVTGHNRRFYYQAVRDAACGRHMHLKCVKCGKLVHLSPCVSDFIERQVLAANRFVIDEGMTLLLGRCRACSRPGEEEARP